MVTAAHPLATKAAYDQLRAGGTAVDAAIAAQMVLTLVEPQSSGIGGGAFLMHFDGERVEAYDGRETAPAAATERLFQRADGAPLAFYDAVVGGRSVGAPGVLRMLERAHRAHGKLPWKRLFEPAIALAEEGFAMSPRLATLVDGDPLLAKDPVARAYFYDADGKAKAAGTVLRNPGLAAVLREVADRGADAFYTGPIARDIVAKVEGHANNPGLLTAADLAGYHAEVREPVCADYRTWTVCGMPPPSSGGIAIAQMLGMLEGSPRGAEIARERPVQGRLGWEPTPGGVHLFADVGRLAYADRDQYVADPAFVPLPGGDWRSLLDKQYLEERARRITVCDGGREAPAGTPSGATAALARDESPELPSTSHLSVVDAFGSAVAMTSSIEDAFGSRQMVRGFLLNNQLTDFSFVPERGGKLVANRVQPGKRPRSSMSPTLVFEKGTRKLVMTLGSPGGPAIINYVAKVLVGTLDWHLNVQEAIALPNFGSRNKGTTELERGRASEALARGLAAQCDTVKWVDLVSGLGGIQRVQDHGEDAWFAGADPRREGVAMGE